MDWKFHIVFVSQSQSSMISLENVPKKGEWRCVAASRCWEARDETLQTGEYRTETQQERAIESKNVNRE